MYFFVFKSLHIGGVETLLLRECNWFRKKDDVFVICHHISKIEKEEFIAHNINYLQVNKWTASEIYKAVNNITDRIDFIKFFRFQDFLSFQLKYERKGIRCLFYCVHPRCMFFFQSKPKLKERFGWVFAKAIKKYIDSKNIIFMDQDTIDSSLSYYNIEQYKDKCCVLLLPFRIIHRPIKPKNDDTFQILTVGRADFPYKGYIIGLIEDFNKNIDLMKNSRLTIISTGDDINEIQNRINTVNEKTKSCIEFIKGLPPEKLSDYYSKTDVYIGMGTTILEATSYGIPCIVARYDTMSFTAKGFFYEDPEEIGGKYTNEPTAFEKVLEVMNSMEEEYKSMQKQSLRALKLNYDEDVILNEFDHWQLESSSIRIGIISKSFVKVYFWLSDKNFD